MTRLEFDCYYEGGESLKNQSFCPEVLNGQPLLYTETRIVEDVTEPRPWWLLLIFVVVIGMSKRK